MTVTVTIPGEPVSLNNAYYTPRGQRRRVLSTEGRDFKTLVAYHVRQARVTAPEGRLHLTLHLYGHWDTRAGVPRRRDVSNAAKLAEDALCEALGIDDCWIRRLTVVATHTPTQPRIVATLEALT